MLLKDFDRIVCLCLDQRKNEWSKLSKQFEERDAKVQRFIVGKGGHNLPYDFKDPTEYDQSHPWLSSSFTFNAYCCHLAHRKILEQAKNDKVETLLLLEDDCWLTEEFDHVLNNVMQQIDESNLQWDVLYYGSNHTWGQTTRHSQNLLKLNGGSYCWHCVAINQKHHDVIGKLLSYPVAGPFDWLSAHELQLDQAINCYAIWPTIAIQKPGMSFVLNSMQDYTGYFNNQGKQN